MRRLFVATITALALIAPFSTASADETTTTGKGTGVVTTADVETTVERLSGSTRYGTAAKVASAWAAGIGVAFVVNGENYPDALAAAARAGVHDAPVLLVKTGSVPAETEQALRRLQPSRIVVVGGTSAVSEAAVDSLRQYTTTGSVDRLAGGTRYATAAAVASQYEPRRARVYLASGETFPDALSAAALAGHQHMPLLLTRAGSLDAVTITQLQRLSVDEVVVLGGTSAVSDDVARQAAGYALTKTPRRLSGSNRYQTAALVAEQFPAGVSPAYVASGETFPDALVGAALAGREGVPLVLSRPDRVPPGTARALARQRPSAMYVLGGMSVIQDSTMTTLAKAARAPAAGPAFGATFHGFWNYESEAQMVTALRSLKRAGGNWVRIDLGWAAVETTKDVYSDWALGKYDTAINSAHAEGLNVLIVLQRTPEWANGSNDHTLAPESTSEFGDFARDMTLRYAGKVQAIEVWNEPNLDSFFTARSAGKEAEEHASMVKDAYTKIKADGPQGSQSVTVLAGGPSHVDTQWWRRMYQLGIKDYTDVVAVNPYMADADLSPLMADTVGKYRMNHTAALIQLMSEYGDDGKPIWFTEFGWSAHANTPATAPWNRGVSETRQADYLQETFTLLQSEYPTVKQVFWYNLREKATGSIHQDNYGLLNRDLTRKPVAQRLADILGGS